MLVEGIEYPIVTDFRACLRVILAFEDVELTALEKQVVLIENLFPIKPPDLQAAFEVGTRFLNGGKHELQEGQGSQEEALRLYSLEKDAGLIFAAFRQTHGIDLETVELHWWKFLALFMDLGSEATFCQLIALRSRVKKGTASKEERQAARAMGEVFEIEELATPEEKAQENEFLRLVALQKKG